MRFSERYTGAWRRVTRRWRQFTGDRRGAVAIVFIFALIPMVAAGGAAIDISRAYLVKQRLGMALDAAGLAVGSSTGDQAQLEAIMQRYFDANYPANEIGVPATPVMTIVDDTITLTATADVNATLMSVLGVHNITVAENSTIVREIKGMEVVLVLDNTGSMKHSGKIGALRTAAYDLVDILFGSQAFPPNLKVALVPYVTTVNIGTGNIAHTDQAGAAYWHGRNFNNISTNHFDLFTSMGVNWKGCVEARRAPYDVQDVPPTPGTPDTYWVPYFWPDEPDNDGDVNNDYMDDDVGGSFYNRQKNQNKYSDASAIATISTDETPQSTSGPNKSCPQEIVPLTNDRDRLFAEVNAMDAWNNSGTNGALGLIWGLRVISPGVPYTEGTGYNDDANVKAIIMLTDGVNQVCCQGGTPNRSDYGGYGFLNEERLGTNDRNDAEDEVDAKFTQVCNLIKGINPHPDPKHIRLYTITFQVTSSSLRTLYENCATTPDMYFNSPSNAELRSVFQEIAQELSNLRIGS